MASRGWRCRTARCSVPERAGYRRSAQRGHDGATFQQLADMLGISASMAHQSVERLRHAGLVRSAKREVMRPALLEFLEHGVRYAFPAAAQGRARGVPTAHAGPALAPFIVADEPVVWPSASGSVVGPSVAPLYRQAAELPERSPNVYSLLTLVDALRVGRVRERTEAVRLLRDRFYFDASRAA
jgi:hypothetical protein